MGKVFNVYYPEKQPLGCPETFDYVKANEDKLARIEEVAQEWLTRLPGTFSHNSFIAHIPIEVFAEPISVKNYLTFKALNWIAPANALAVINKQVYDYSKALLNPAKPTVSAANTEIAGIRSTLISADIKVANQAIEYKYLKFYADWIKCQVLVESNDPILVMPLAKLMSDFYTGKYSYNSAIHNRGLVIVDMPISITGNKQLLDVLIDLCTAREQQSTMFTSLSGKCKMRRDDGEIDLISEIANALEIANLHAEAVDVCSSQELNVTRVRQAIQNDWLLEQYIDEEC